MVGETGTGNSQYLKPQDWAVKSNVNLKRGASNTVHPIPEDDNSQTATNAFTSGLKRMQSLGKYRNASANSPKNENGSEGLATILQISTIYDGFNSGPL
jgi:hypothetical protein